MNYERPSWDVGQDCFGVHGIQDVEIRIICHPDVDLLLDSIKEALEVGQALNEGIQAALLLLQLAFIVAHGLVLAYELL